MKTFGEEPGSSIGWFGILSFYLHYITPLSNVNTPRKRVCPDKRKPPETGRLFRLFSMGGPLGRRSQSKKIKGVSVSRCLPEKRHRGIGG